MNQDNQEKNDTLAHQPFVRMAEHPNGKKHNTVLIIVLSIVGVIVGAVVLCIGMLLYVGDYRGRATQSNIKRHVTNALPVVILCTDAGAVLYPPKDGGSVCAGQDYTWPALEQYGASWGGCPFMVEQDAENPEETRFQYCATMPDGSRATCTGGEEYGCAFE